MKNRASIDAVEHHLSNALIESTNTKIRMHTRIAFGFRSAQALIALAMLSAAAADPTPRPNNRIPHPRITQ